MVSPIGWPGPLPAMPTGSQAAGRSAVSGKVSNEFLTIFYKELLKQVFKTPDLSLGNSADKESRFSTFNSELMVDQLAEQLAKNAAFQPSWISRVEAGQ